MFPPGHRFLRAAFRLAACLLLAAGSGCGVKWPWFHEQTGPLLESTNVKDLRPGCYCEIEMTLPPMASKDSFHCFKGTVKEINSDEVVLVDVREENYIEYGPNSHQRPPTQQKRDLVRVPLTGVDEIWALPTAKDNAQVKPPPKSSAIALPSRGRNRRWPRLQHRRPRRKHRPTSTRRPPCRSSSPTLGRVSGQFHK